MRQVWAESHAAASVALVAEACAAIAAAHRAARIDDAHCGLALSWLAARWEQTDSIGLSEELAWRAGELAGTLALRGYDAIHLATAEDVLGDGDVMVVADERLAEAARALGLDALVPVA